MKTDAALDVLTYGDPILRRKAKAVQEIDEHIRELVGEMVKSLHSHNGIGLAAPQVGESIALCVIDLPPGYDSEEKNGPRLNPDVAMPLIMLDPEITEADGSQTCDEGCLSFPEISVPIARAYEVTVVFKDMEAASRSLRVKGLLARAVQHEADHLCGVLIVDRMSPVKRVSLSGQLKALRRKTLERLGKA